MGGLFSYSWAQPESFAPPDGFFDFSAASLKERPGDQSPRLSAHTGSPVPVLSALLLPQGPWAAQGGPGQCGFRSELPVGPELDPAFAGTRR